MVLKYYTTSFVLHLSSWNVQPVFSDMEAINTELYWSVSLESSHADNTSNSVDLFLTSPDTRYQIANFYSES
jgi:hypothetical protein